MPRGIERGMVQARSIPIDAVGRQHVGHSRGLDRMGWLPGIGLKAPHRGLGWRGRCMEDEERRRLGDRGPPLLRHAATAKVNNFAEAEADSGPTLSAIPTMISTASPGIVRRADGGRRKAHRLPGSPVAPIGCGGRWLPPRISWGRGGPGAATGNQPTGSGAALLHDKGW
jgi:hypothetical protein